MRKDKSFNNMRNPSRLYQSWRQPCCFILTIACLFVLQTSPVHSGDSVAQLEQIARADQEMEMEDLRGMKKEFSSRPRHTETPTLRIAQQFGLGYLPLMLVRQHKLIEKHAKKLGD